ncbi:MAG: lytic transglycosylase domain-containing protein [Bacteroidales bacterium]|nr:lytic transglycosylase domain-containing protein [Bacteroidales bacterium]
MSNNEKRFFRWFSLLLGMVLIIVLALNLSFTQTPVPDEEDHSMKFQRDYSIYSLDMPDTLYFAGERVPVDYFDVREDLDRELLVNTYWQSHTLLLIKRANRYLPLIDSILGANGVPEDFKYIPLIESELTNAVSPAGAVGLWQFLRGTGRDYGLEINTQVDERYHVEKATEAACRFFKESYRKFGSWTLAAASFNYGRSALNRQLKRQEAESYYNLILNQETARYIYRILALKMILEDPEKYGFHIRPHDLYYPVPTRRVQVDTAVDNFAKFARDHSINYKYLKILNPWLRESYLKNPDGKTYQINIPREGERDYRSILQANIDSL